MAQLHDMLAQPILELMRRKRAATPTPLPTVTPAPTPAETPEQKAAKRAAEIASARSKALYNSDLFLRSKGLDPAAYSAMLNSEFDRIQANIGEGDDVRTAFSGDIINSLLQGERARRYREFDNQADNAFSQGFEKRDMPSSLLDDVIGEILGKQKNDALQYLDRGKARGMFNDVGYNAGLSAIDNAAAAGRSELGTLGNSVLDKYRGMGDAVRDKAYSALGSWDIGDNFSIDPYVSEYQGIINDARNNAGGDLRNVLGGKNFFDLNRVTQSAGTAQGAINLRDADVATALAERKRKNSLSRGLGSQGAF